MPILINNKLLKPQPSVVYDTYWKFAAERQSVFFNRLNNPVPPWTSDIILRLFKFTNAYRVIDRVSQYLVKEIVNNNEFSDEDLLFRILFFKIFNKIETWQHVERTKGEISYSTYSFNEYNEILNRQKLKGTTIYSAAYIMASGKSIYGYEYKHTNHLKLLEALMNTRIREKILSCQSFEELYIVLKELPTIGSFLAYQYATDINYSRLTNFSEMDFVKAGPGAKDGIKKCFTSFGNYTEEDIIKLMTDRQEHEFDRLGLKFQNLWGRPLQLIDCQNLFCEVDKYARVAHPEIIGISNRIRIKQKFTPLSLKPIDYCLPLKWGISIPKSITV